MVTLKRCQQISRRSRKPVAVRQEQVGVTDMGMNEIHQRADEIDDFRLGKSVVLQEISGVYTTFLHRRFYTATLINQVQDLNNNSSLSRLQPLQTLLQFLPSLSMFRPIIL